MTSPLQRKLKISGPTAVTANRLADGVVVWLDADGAWSLSIADAAVATTGDEVQALLARAHQDENTAVGAYAAAVSLTADGRAAPANLRERIRVEGPTVAYAVAPHSSAAGAA
ncbi:DUF2849 domain-containing protein [Xanthobacter sp. V4C-4]|uniref:DUF2849 domain-containing protein n=1 Tax=Xanthobacter cornucopiae TaxID=3119924 RepID=UPI0037292FE5